MFAGSAGWPEMRRKCVRGQFHTRALRRTPRGCDQDVRRDSAAALAGLPPGGGAGVASRSAPANQKRALRRDQQDGDQKGLRQAHQKAESEAATEAASERRPSEHQNAGNQNSKVRPAESEDSGSRNPRLEGPNLKVRPTETPKFGSPKPQIRAHAVRHP